jgi:hypothetical protein
VVDLSAFYRPIFGSHGSESYPSVAEVKQEGERLSSERTSLQRFHPVREPRRTIRSTLFHFLPTVASQDSSGQRVQDEFFAGVRCAYSIRSSAMAGGRKQAHDESHDWLRYRRGLRPLCGVTSSFLPAFSLHPLQSGSAQHGAAEALCGATLLGRRRAASQKSPSRSRPLHVKTDLEKDAEQRWQSARDVSRFRGVVQSNRPASSKSTTTESAAKANRPSRLKAWLAQSWEGSNQMLHALCSRWPATPLPAARPPASLPRRHTASPVCTRNRHT